MFGFLTRIDLASVAMRTVWARDNRVCANAALAIYVVAILLAAPILAASGQKEPEKPARVGQDSCRGIRLKASIGKAEYFVKEAILVTVSVQNNSDHPIALRRDMVGSKLTYERWQRGHWEWVGGAGLGRGVGSSGSKPPETSKAEAVKAALENYVVLYPRETFATTATPDPSFLTSKDESEATPKGRYRLTFDYADDRADITPAYSSTCRFTSNRVTFDLK